MLHFKDLNLTGHVVNLKNLNNVVIISDHGKHRFSFHLAGSHVLCVQVDPETAKRINTALGENS